jgi:hypothetical protein
MAEYTGSALYLAFKGTSVASDYRDYANSEEIGTTDASAGADASRTFLTTLTDGTATLSLVDQTGGTATTAPYNLMAPGAEGTLEWGPEGTASNAPRHYVNAIVTNRNRSFPYADVVVLDISFQYSGDVTDTAYA